MASGLWPPTGGAAFPEETRRSLLEEALELGINFFDTADTYGEGYGEEVLAKFMGHRRHEMIIATKFGYDFYDQSTPRIGHGERPQKFEPEFIRFACEQSLRRLDTDYIDLYQLHNPRIATIEDDDVFETLEALKDEGKIRHYGSALGPDIGWFEEGQASMAERHVSSMQIIYSILEQDPAKDFFPIADRKNRWACCPECPTLRKRSPAGTTRRRSSTSPTIVPSVGTSGSPRLWLKSAR